jgi:hypothetical protein
MYFLSTVLYYSFTSTGACCPISFPPGTVALQYIQGTKTTTHVALVLYKTQEIKIKIKVKGKGAPGRASGSELGPPLSLKDHANYKKKTVHSFLNTAAR